MPPILVSHKSILAQYSSLKTSECARSKIGFPATPRPRKMDPLNLREKDHPHLPTDKGAPFYHLLQSLHNSKQRIKQHEHQSRNRRDRRRGTKPSLHLVGRLLGVLDDHHGFGRRSGKLRIALLRHENLDLWSEPRVKVYLLIDSRSHILTPRFLSPFFLPSK